MPKILYIIKVILIFYVFKFGSELIGEAIAIAVHFACGKNPLQGELFDEKTIMLITYFGYALIIGVIILLWKLFQKKTISELGFTKRFGSYFIGVVIGTVLLALAVSLTMLTGVIQYNGIFENIDTSMVLLMIPCFIFQGAMEEVLCRGVVQQLLIKKVSVPVAVGVSAVLFTIPHLNSMSFESPEIVAVAVTNLILISIIFSILTIRFKSIWAACGLHSFWNYVLYSILGLNLSGNDEIVAAVFDIRTSGANLLNGGVYGIEASVLCTAVLAATLVILFVLSRKELAEKGSVRTDADKGAIMYM